MKSEIKYIYITGLIILIINLFSVITDEDLLSDFKFVNDLKFKLVSDIKVGEVFSNSFFFTSQKNLNLKKDVYYKLEHLDENDIIYFKVNTIKFKDTLYFFQHIDWLTKKSKKIKNGSYALKVSYQ